MSAISRNELETWADFLLHQCLGGIDRDDVVMLKGEAVTWPLLSILQDKIFAAGAIADVNMVAPDNNRGQVWGAAICRHGSLEQIARVPEWHRQRYQAMNKYIEILGSEHPEWFANLPAETAMALARADEPFKTIRMGKKWLLTLYPTPAFAALEGMSLEEYTRIIVQASTTDPTLLAEVERPLAEKLASSSMVRIHTAHPDDGRILELTMSVAGRLPVTCVGERNFPDGEVYTSPDANTVNGEIFIDLPVYYNGVTMEGIFLRFAEGRIVHYKAQKEHDTLSRIIETDEGAHRLGEVAFGMNRGITRALKHPLFVEKVGGTLHIAIGASYDHCYTADPHSPEGRQAIEEYQRRGVLNRSAQHVDVVVDFRPGGAGRAVWLDDTRLEVRDRLWVVP